MIERSKDLQCGLGSTQITGCRIALHPMTDEFVDVILGGLAKTDMSSVWRATDSLGTLLRGQMVDVVNTSMLLFANAYREDIHMAASMTYSKGCPGDVEADYLKDVTPRTEWVHTDNDSQMCEATISFYTFGVSDYMDHIYHVIDMIKEKGLYSEKSHYSTILSGSIYDVFHCYQDILEYADANLSHFVIETTVSVNSPSNKGEK
ncbi:MAG: YkoF family thiamine/hydroxymethylpyrimidine-binding protein [Erysipelothrix sp.]